jgi:ATP-dependent Clp protease adaptor protein ClpS
MTAKPEKQRESAYELGNKFELILLNDEVNSFEFVIEKLVECCGHGLEQAEQCALIAHQKGECNILVGYHEHLIEVGYILGEYGLTVDVRKLVI